MRLCPKCQLEISEQASFCEHCGTQSTASGHPPPRGSGVLGGLVTFVVSIVLLYFLWTNFGYLLNTSSSDTGNTTSSQPSTHKVKYMVDGHAFYKETDNIMSITMTNSSGGIEQRTVHSPWKTEFSGNSGLIVSLSVSNR